MKVMERTFTIHAADDLGDDDLNELLLEALEEAMEAAKVAAAARLSEIKSVRANALTIEVTE